MADLAIHVADLGKRFRVGPRVGGYRTLREIIMDEMRRSWEALAKTSCGVPRGREADETIWALRHVSFEVRRGEVIGIIGSNGAGKSTLLKILSQITEPTEGYADVYGRVASLLEVGTGFHPELTGRENVYLNGAILGMGRAEIRRKFDEIVTFAGVERFIDTPVKHYSSGMAVRLAFAVAAHLEPEILIIDEVLAVGDAAFQKRCLGRMHGVAKEGRTVLFVSHNMIAVQSLCHRAIWLNDGAVMADGPAEHVVSRYLRMAASSRLEQRWDDPARAPGTQQVRLHEIRVRGSEQDRPHHITTEQPCTIETAYWNYVPNAVLHVTLHVYTEQGVLAFTTGSGEDSSANHGELAVGLYRSICCIPGRLLNGGLHRIVVLLVSNRARVLFRHEDALSFEVLDTGKRQLGWQGREPGAVRPHLPWITERVMPADLVHLSPASS